MHPLLMLGVAVAIWAAARRMPAVTAATAAFQAALREYREQNRKAPSPLPNKHGQSETVPKSSDLR